MLFFIFRFTLTTTAEIIITDLNRNDGFVALQGKDTKIIQNLNLHLHTVNVEMIQGNIDLIAYALKIFCKNNLTSDFHKVLERRIIKLSENFQRLKPINHRQKRGLINALGTVIKSITGNLDNNDLFEINRRLDDSTTKTNNLIDNNNRQIIINNRLQSKLNDIVLHMNEQHTKLLKEISVQINKKHFETESFWKQRLYELLFNIQFLNQEINEIIEAVQLAKLGVVCKNILSLNELKHFHKLLTEQNVTIDSLDQVYEYLGIEVFHKNHTIIFVIKIPNFEPFLYESIDIKLLPKNNSILAFDYENVITNRTITFVPKIPCYTIENYKFCNRKTLKDISEDNCISNALKGIPARCNFKEYHGGTQIDIVNDYAVLIKDAHYPTSIKSECNIKERSVTGTLLISYKGCDITINNTKFSGKSHVAHHEIKIIPMIGIPFKQEWLFKEHNISQIQISNIHHIEKIEQKYTKLQYITIGGYTLTFLCCVIIILWCLLTRKSTHVENNHIKCASRPSLTSNSNIEVGECSQRCCGVQNSDLPKTIDPVTASSSQKSNKDSGRIFLKEGVVTKPFMRFHLETKSDAV